MGIRDRHYFLDASSPKPPVREPSTVRVALFWIAVLAILFAAFKLIPLMVSQPAAVGPVPVAVPVAPTASPPTPVAPAAPSLPRGSRATPSSSSSSIYRCGNEYSHTPCAGGRVVAQPAAAGFDSRPNDRLARFVADGRSASDDGTTTVTRTVTTVDATGADRSNQCASWAAEIVEIDHATRQPLSAYRQDRYRERRKGVRDQQAAMHC